MLLPSVARFSDLDVYGVFELPSAPNTASLQPGEQLLGMDMSLYKTSKAVLLLQQPGNAKARCSLPAFQGHIGYFWFYLSRDFTVD
jgi:hypothetical protein